MNLRRSARILVQTSLSIKRSERDGTMDTVSSGTTGVPSSHDPTNSSVIRNSDHHTNDKISNLRMRPCSVQLHDILDFNDTEKHYLISKCRTKNYKTCNILITDNNFTSDLTNKHYFTRSYDDLNCKSANVVYGLECNLCVLVYDGETKGKLHKQICGHRSGIINNDDDIAFQHFNQPDHSLLSMPARIIEKIYQSKPRKTPLRRQKEDYWIRELVTAIPYGCNDKIDGIGILSRPTCRSVNVMDIFNSAPRLKRSHGDRHYTSPIFHDVSLNDHISLMQKPLGMHPIRSKLFSLPFQN